jgi:hypothetical protein
MKKYSRLVAVGVLAAVMAVFLPASPAAANGDGQPVSVTVCCLKGQPITVEIAGVDLAADQVQLLVDKITAFLLEKEAAAVGEVIDVLEALEDLLRFVIIPFLERLVDDVAALGITIKENIEGLVAGKCVTTDVWKADTETCLLVDPS